MAWDVVLFDLDGTVSDSAPGILTALRHAFAINGLPALDEATERAILGPPFYESLPPLIGSTPLEDVIAAYRARYKETMYDTRTFPGVPELLHGLRQRGVRLAVATSKPERYAEPIVEHLGLRELFVTVGGDSVDGERHTKALVVEHVLRQLGNPDPAGVVMVGDREHDVHGARVHGIDCLAVRWGYAAPGELEAARPRQLCETPADLARALDVPGAASR
jgi:phosphoglycolate phosphatase